VQFNRRKILKSGLGATALFLPLPYAWVWAQNEGALKLLKAPKVALVVGNGKYKDAPELKNAPNDAKAVGETLKSSGFAVTLLLETNREALIGAIRNFVNAMEKQKAVGLFYFAGHGVQLDWRNYMLPVDAVIDTVEDVGKQSVDIARLMEGLVKAANPMNVIILDACREDPFGKAKKAPQKGLSQMDAPTQTILAYATSPGNVASDGDGANGLYTENLLREMKVPEAKIEDVFKRVRLGVRRTSKGAQIPWESTSLEEDFWFLPPKELRKISEAEKEKAFDAELKLWESIRESKAPGPLEDYLRRFPSGEFTELAQLQLDKVLAQQGEKKVVAVAQAGNPYTQGTVRFDPDFKVGDFYEVRVHDMETKAEIRRLRPEVTQITDSEVQFSSGLIVDRMGNTRRLPDGTRFTDNQNIPLEFQVGARWTTQFRNFPPNVPSHIYIMNVIEFRITGREKVTVPAGNFDCFRIEGRGQVIAPKGRADIVSISWWAPDRVRRPIAHEFTRKPQPGSPARPSAERTELIAYKQA
jgi:hypothetical protein